MARTSIRRAGAAQGGADKTAAERLKKQTRTHRYGAAIKNAFDYALTCASGTCSGSHDGRIRRGRAADNADGGVRERAAGPEVNAKTQRVRGGWKFRV